MGLGMHQELRTVPTPSAILMAGVPAANHTLYHRIRFAVGDPVAIIETAEGGPPRRTLILRDIEMHRARQHARADVVASPADFTPPGGLSGDRETATAQAAAECLARAGITAVRADRSLPLLFAHEAQRRGIQVQCDADLGVAERRSKDEQEIAWLRQAQRDTEQAVEMACRLVARAMAAADGVLRHDGDILTAERVRQAIDLWLLERGYLNPQSIVSGGPAGADCHDVGRGPLRTGEPVIVDVFPKNRETLYNGDCTRTVVHGQPTEAVLKMHAAAVAAKSAAIAATRPGLTGEALHQVAAGVIVAHGYAMGLPGPGDPPTRCAMVHGTGHGVGLDVHEPPLLDRGGPALVVGDCLTIEPGLYCPAIGGVRVEDMVIVTADGCLNLNSLPDGLDWR